MQRTGVVVSSLQPYPACKDSGVDWLGDLPAHWDVRRLRNVSELLVSNVDKHTREGETPVRLCNYVDVYKNDRIRSGMAFMAGTATDDEIQHFRLRRGDVLITKDSEVWNDIGVPALVEEVEDDVVSGYHLALLRPRPRCLGGRFLFRALESCRVAQQLHVQANGVTRFGLSHNAIKSVRLPVPPLPEQAAIVRFLDHADRRIRRYIRAKQKLIALLEEQKQAVIHEAVTGRIDVRTGRPYPAYQDSAVARLGRVPAHWGVRRLKSLVKRIDQGVSPQAENSAADGNSWGVLKAGCVNGGVFRDSEHKRLPPAFVFDAALTVRLGDVLVSRASGSPRFVGSVGRVSALKYRLILSDKTFRPVFTDEADPDFMVLAMNAPYYRQQVEGAISGAEGLPNNLPLSSLRAFRFGIPTIDEQRDVVRYVTTICSDKLGGALSRAQHEVSLLKEYRTRLIADVVTGKLDVREAALRLPALDSVASGANWDDDLRRHAGSAARGTAAQRAPLPDVGDAEQSVAAGELVDDG